MANEFVYRADPPGRLAATGDLAALARAQVEAGLSVVTPGRPVEAAEARRSPDDAVARLSRELAEVLAATENPVGTAVKLCLPLPGTVNLDPMLLAGLLANLIDEGARILELDGRAYADPATDPGNDGFTLMGLPRPEGFRLAIDMGPLADWTAERIEAVAGELQADRYRFDVADGDDLSVLAAVPEPAMVVLGALDPSGGQEDDAVLGLIDRAAEAVDQDRLALSTRGACEGLAEADQARVLRRLAELSERFWGFAM